jgi:hypothetical protein
MCRFTCLLGRQMDQAMSDNICYNSFFNLCKKIASYVSSVVMCYSLYVPVQCKTSFVMYKLYYLLSGRSTSMLSVIVLC